MNQEKLLMKLMKWKELLCSQGYQIEVTDNTALQQVQVLDELKATVQTTRKTLSELSEKIEEFEKWLSLNAGFLKSSEIIKKLREIFGE